jgi:hypothetical protein
VGYATLHTAGTSTSCTVCRHSPGGVVGVECLAEALCGRDGGAHDLRIGGRKREVHGGVRRRSGGNAGPARKGAHFAEHVVIKPCRDV